MNESNSSASLSGDREIAITRLFDAPPDLVFAAWTDSKRIAHWWGPNGFTLTTHEMNVRPGGVWDFIMHGPDGADYKSKITFIEVVKNERIVYKHAGGTEHEPVNFHVAVTFEEVAGKTRLNMRMTFPSAIARETVVKKYGAVEGLTQTIGRLGQYLATLPR